MYEGYFLPKGTLFIANIWYVSYAYSIKVFRPHVCLYRAILRDPDTYSDPDLFKPERYLAGDGSVPEPDPRMAVFGFGRRYVAMKNTA